MLTNVLILTCNDLVIAVKNRTLLLVFLIPLFVFMSLKLVDTEADFQKINIGLLHSGNYTEEFLEGLHLTERVFNVNWLTDMEEAVSGLRDKSLDGILSPDTHEPARLVLTVLTRSSLQTQAIVETVTSIQNTSEGRSSHWISNILATQGSGIQIQTLPTWILMLVLLVGFIILPTQVAEEKEKNLLLGLLQAPVSEIEWLSAKTLLGMLLVGLAVGFLQLLGQFDFSTVSVSGYVLFLVSGGFCFSAFGIFLGFLCRSQASARTLGVLLYMPNLLPAALSDFSQTLTHVAPFFPSYHFYGPLKAFLLEGGQVSGFSADWIYLVLLGLVMTCLSWLIMRRRWLM